VFATGCIASELGGGRAAQVVAALLACFTPFFLAVSHFYSMNGFDVLFWTLLWWLALRILLRDEPRLWLAFGALAGLGLENKYSVGFLGAALVVGLAATRARKHLSTHELWLGGALALLLFAPHLGWELAHGGPTLEFMRNAATEKNYPVSPLEFLGGQLLLMNPLFAPIWLAGLAWLLLAPRNAGARALAVAYLALLAFMIATRAKVYYLGPAYALLLAAGAVALCRGLDTRRGGRAAQRALGAAVLVFGAAAVPLAVPVLAPERFIAYSAALGVRQPKMERADSGRLPQVFAFMFGWRELAEEVARVYQALPPEERAHAAILGRNYAEAGAIDYFGAQLGLPHAISPHNSYWLWGPGDWDGRVLIVIGEIPPERAAWFESVEEKGRRECPLCMPYEADLPILVARGLRIPVSQAWAELKHFE